MIVNGTLHSIRDNCIYLETDESLSLQGNGSIFTEGVGEFLPGYFALDPKNKAFIAVFEDFPGCYLVTSQNPDPDVEQLLAHFADFIKNFGSASSAP